MIESESFFAYSDSFCFYINRTCKNPRTDSAVVKRFKRELRKNKGGIDLLERLNDFINLFEGESRTFSASLSIAIRATTIRRLSIKKLGNGHLIEIRIPGTLWRVLSYIDEASETIVMIDAMEAHNHVRISDFAQQKKEEIKEIERIIEKECQNGR